MRKLLTTGALLVAPMLLVACGEKAEEAAPVEEVATEVVEEAPMDPTATDAAADAAAAPAAAAEDATAPAGDTMTAEPDDKTGPPER